MSDTTSPFTHRICERCWFDRPTSRTGRPRGVSEQGVLVMPFRVVGAEDPDNTGAFCCFCAGVTITRIWVRLDPRSGELRCDGDHDNPEVWTKFIAAGKL